MQSQKASVYAAVLVVMGLDDGHSGLVELSKEQRKEVIGLVTSSIMNGETEFSDEARTKYDTTDKVKTYTNGLVSNWLRKDVRLNGGDKYVAKNPGSRAGSGDEVLKNLKALKSTLTDVEHVAAVDDEIAKRTAELATAKAKTVAIDESKIPESLRHLLSA